MANHDNGARRDVTVRNVTSRCGTRRHGAKRDVTVRNVTVRNVTRTNLGEKERSVFSNGWSRRVAEEMQ